MKASKHFSTEELVSPQVYKQFGDFSVTLIDKRMLDLLDIFRDYFGKLIINDWEWNDNSLTNFRYSGLRTMQDEYYKIGSQHSYGRAMDIKTDAIPSLQLQKIIIAQKEYFLNHLLTGIEKNTDGWTHITCGYYPEAEGRLVLIPNKESEEIEYV